MSEITSKTKQLELFQAQDAQAAGVESPPIIASDDYGQMRPPCCGTGCAVCVLDYWEPDQSESETLAMLEAIEQAQSLAEQDTDLLESSK